MEYGVLQLPSVLASIAAAEEFVCRLADELGLDEDGRDRLGLAVHEAVANAVIHGNRFSPDKQVRLSARHDATRLTVTVSDEGPGFTPGPQPTGALNLTPSGRGLTLIEHCVDGLHVTRRSGPPSGCDVVLVKHLRKDTPMPALSVSEREVGDVTVIDLKGRITIGEGNVTLREAVARALDSGRRNLLLDLSEVTYADSAGIGELLACHTTTEKRNGRLKLLNASKQVQDLMMITKLLTHFEVYDTEKEALASFT
ncbi:anti-sigma factor antagonist [Kitasatospora sp. NPDC086791]|uniref:anti-sigma factor antagonist n=1 Tax=Kitasatospora sp. NPDC086791 TaxID=3155178 RepID=UPI00344A2E49